MGDTNDPPPLAVINDGVTISRGHDPIDRNDPAIVGVIDSDDFTPVFIEIGERDPGYMLGPKIVAYYDAGHGTVEVSLRDVLSWCLGPGREVLAANGLVILGGSVAP